MNLDAILDGIKEAGEQEITRIELETGRQTSQITAKIQKDADVQNMRILADGRARLNREQALIGQQATIQALQIHADARQKLIERVLHTVNGRLEKLRENKQYAHVLKTLVDETLQSIQPSLLPGQKLVMHFDARDQDLVKSFEKDFSIPLIVKFDLTSNGGCTAETEDGLVTALNTVESRFQHADRYIKQRLSIFFERNTSSG